MPAPTTHGDTVTTKRATATKTGRNQRFPYLPVITTTIPPDARCAIEKTWSTVVRGRAFATRDEAVSYAQRCIDAAQR